MIKFLLKNEGWNLILNEAINRVEFLRESPDSIIVAPRKGMREMVMLGNSAEKTLPSFLGLIHECDIFAALRETEVWEGCIHKYAQYI